MTDWLYRVTAMTDWLYRVNAMTVQGHRYD